GGILDVVPPAGDPVRIELWGDEVDTIRLFDPATQRSTDNVDQASIGPAHEVLSKALGISLDLESLRPQFIDAFARDLRLLRAGDQAFGALEFYRGFLGTATLADYLPKDGILAVEEPESVARIAEEFEEQVEQLHADLLERGEVPPGVACPFRGWRHVRSDAVRLEVRFDPDTQGLPFEHAPKYGGRVEPFLTQVTESRGGTTIVVSQQASRLSELFEEQGL